METVTINGFVIYSDGRVQNSRTGNFLNPGPASNGYLYVNLNGRRNRKRQAIHVLVATHFIPNPDNLETVDHINGIRTDNRKENLQWMSLADNASKAISMKIIATNIQTEEELIFESQSKASEFLKINQPDISRVINGIHQHKNGWKFKKYKNNRS